MWWARQDSNLEPTGYEPAALTVVLQARRGCSNYSRGRDPVARGYFLNSSSMRSAMSVQCAFTVGFAAVAAAAFACA